MKNKYVFVVVMLLSILIANFGFTSIYVSQQNEGKKEDEFVVVTSFYPMYIAAMNVIGDIEDVTLKNLSEPQTGCLHDFQLTPEDMKLLSTADVFIMNGGGIESFIEDIAKAYPELLIIEACEGMELLEGGHEHVHEEDAYEVEELHTHEDKHVHETEELHTHEDEHIHETEELHTHEDEYVHETEDVYTHEGEDVNAHAWMSVELYREQIRNIAKGLAEADTSHAQIYLKNAQIYDEKLTELEQLQKEVMEITAKQEVILFHCAYDYVAEDLGLPIAFCMDLDEERQVSAKEVADVVDIINDHHVSYIFAEQLYAESMCNMIKNETDVNVVYLDPLTRGEYDKDSYIEGMRNNLLRMKEAFSQ